MTRNTNNLDLYYTHDIERRLHNFDNSIAVIRAFFKLHPEYTNAGLLKALSTIEEESIIFRKSFNGAVPSSNYNIDEILKCALSIVLIEDTIPIAEYWKAKALQIGKKVHHFPSPSVFLKHLAEFDRELPIVIDQTFRTDMTGIEFTKILHDRGFKVLILSTSDKNLDLTGSPWIIGIMDKLPKW